MRNSIACGVFAALTAAGFCEARSLPSLENSIQLRVISGRPVVDGVFLNGQGPYRFLLDTGARRNMVETRIAHKLGLTPTFRTDVITVAGAIQAVGGMVDNVSLGSVTAFGQEFLFMSMDVAHLVSSGIQGVLGQKFLTNFDYLLDFANHRLIFGGPAPDGGSRVSIESIEERPAIQTSEGMLVLDSGTDIAILFRTSSLAWASDGAIHTASGSASVSTFEGKDLRIAGRLYRTRRTAFVAKGDLYEDGELPASLFRAVFVSNSGKFAILDAR